MSILKYFIQNRAYGQSQPEPAVPQHTSYDLNLLPKVKAKDLVTKDITNLPDQLIVEARIDYTQRQDPSYVTVRIDDDIFAPFNAYDSSHIAEPFRKHHASSLLSHIQITDFKPILNPDLDIEASVYDRHYETLQPNLTYRITVLEDSEIYQIPEYGFDETGWMPNLPYGASFTRGVSRLEDIGTVYVGFVETDAGVKLTLVTPECCRKHNYALPQDVDNQRVVAVDRPALDRPNIKTEIESGAIEITVTHQDEVATYASVAVVSQDPSADYIRLQFMKKGD